jgi:hypothetical protein
VSQSSRCCNSARLPPERSALNTQADDGKEQDRFDLGQTNLHPTTAGRLQRSALSSFTWTISRSSQ